jgi:formylglycine-generating enzyme required for sulfatase activity
MKAKLLIGLALGLSIAVGLGIALKSKGVNRLSEPKPASIWTEPSTGMQFVWVPSGCATIGSSGKSEYGTGQDSEYEVPPHKVCVKGFYLGKYEVSQAEYEKLVGKNPSRFKGADRPVENITWEEAQAMTSQLSRESGNIFRLPSEAEWEYACRAGGQHKAIPGKHKALCGDGNLDDLAWYNAHNNYSTQPVGRKQPNAWGLHDMNGNVWEWTEDCWHPSYLGAPADGSAWLAGGDCDLRTMRGGGWNNYESIIDAPRRSWISTKGPLNTQSDNIGFRLIRML